MPAVRDFAVDKFSIRISKGRGIFEILLKILGSKQSVIGKFGIVQLYIRV